MILLFARTFLKDARHLSQMKTLLDNHLDQQRSILAEFTEGGKANVREAVAIQAYLTKGWPTSETGRT